MASPDPRLHRCKVGEIDYTLALTKRVIRCTICNATWTLDPRGWQRHPRPDNGDRRANRGHQ